MHNPECIFHYRNSQQESRSAGSSRDYVPHRKHKVQLFQQYCAALASHVPTCPYITASELPSVICSPSREVLQVFDMLLEAIFISVSSSREENSSRQCKKNCFHIPILQHSEPEVCVTSVCIHISIHFT